MYWKVIIYRTKVHKHNHVQNENVVANGNCVVGFVRVAVGK